MMSLVLRIVVLVMLTALMAAPTVHAADADPVAAMPYRYADFDFKYAWRTVQVDRGLAVDGVLKNVRYASVDDVVLTVSLLNREGKRLADATTFPIPQQIKMDYYSPFDLVLKNVVLSSGDLLRFQIRYRVDEGGNNSFNWLGSFTVDAATGRLLNEKGKIDRW
ncbi:hypothetical protein [Geobacter argillaceus]|nr:hypothetical protein [Geobacter argillaceus]